MKAILDSLKIIFGFFIFPIFIFILYIFLLFFSNIYEVFPWFDIPLHFIGGFAVGHSYFLILNFLQKKNYLKTNSIVRIIFILSLVSLTALFWEFFQYFAEYLTGLGLQGDLDDTILDLIMGVFGGLLAAVSFEIALYKAISKN